MKVLLISLPGSNTGDEPLFPLGIGYLAAMLKAEHEVKAIHYQRIEHVGPTFPDIIKSFRPDIIGLTCSTFNRGNVRKIIAVVKKYCPHVKVIVGGVHASYLYDQVLNNYGADVVVIAEGEYTTLELCRAFENGTALDSVKGIAFKQDGRVVTTPPRGIIENLDELPMPDFDFAEQMMRNSGTGFIITSRGCPVRCIFCSTSSYWGQKVRKNSVERVVDEMEHLISKYGVRKIFFHDDTFNLGIERVKRICNEIMDRKLRVQWGVSCRVVPVSQEMIDVMVAAGCRHICWGVESGSEQMLRRINKKITLEQIRYAYELCRKHHHIMSTGAFAIVGVSGETAETVKQTIDFFNSLPLTDHPSLGPFYLLPGTKIFNDLKAKGRIDDSCWLRTDDTIHYTDENSIQTLRNWSHAISQSGKILPFDRSKHFWNNILFGNIPQPEIPEFPVKTTERDHPILTGIENDTFRYPIQTMAQEEGIDTYTKDVMFSELTSDRSEDIPLSVIPTQTERPMTEIGVKKSELDDLIHPEIKDDKLYYTIERLARKENLKTILEIGSSAGAGSTEAFVAGLRQNRNKPTLFCMEISKPRFAELQKRYDSAPNVKCYNLSSIPLEKFPTEQDIRSFYFNTKTALNNYPIERVLGWLRQDIEYMKRTGLCSNGIQKIKEENNIQNFDMVLIDGSEFAGIAELNEIYGAKFILLDDINGFKNYNNYKRLMKDPYYDLVTEDWELRNGFAVFARNDNTLPIHFFTIVLNGQPFIRHHIEVFKQLPFNWRWHIIEGVAALKHDTAWSVQNGGYISEQLHKNGLSNDGTTEYIDEIAKQFPSNITVYRKANGAFWDGKLEMVNAPLANINEECLLWQVDSDELWTAEQICASRDMFIAKPDRTAAYYLDNFFVGENLVTTTINTYGNNTSYEWLRTWRFNTRLRWTAHEPPRLCMPAQGGNLVDIATIKPFKHHETMAKNLIFQHYAYATEKQLAFKEIYYGYKNAVEQWRHLQQQKDFPVFLRDYFTWVKDGAQVNTIWSQNITPIAQKDANNEWQFSSIKTFSEQQPQPSLGSYKRVLIDRSDSMSNINEEKHCKILTGRQLICDGKTKIANAEKYQMLQAQTFLNEGHIMKALKGFENILALSQETVDAHLGRATCLARLGRLLEAEVEAQQVLSKDPKNLRLLQFLETIHRLKPDLIGDRDIEWGYIKNRVEEMAKIQSRGAKLLDFGCGESAQLTRLTANMGYQVTAIDMVPLIVPLDSTHNIRFIQGDFLHQDWKIKSFDLIINCSSIEHSGLVGRYGVVEQGPDDDLEIVARMSRLIKPNGKMLLTIPVGLDKVVGSLHRVYGQTRLAKLLDGWEVQNSCFWVKDENNQWREVDEESALQREPMLAYGLGCFVLRPALRLTAPSDSTVPPIYDQKPIIFDRGEDKTAVNITVPEASISATSKLRPKVLIVKTDGIGDFVIFSGSLPYYRKLYPNAHIAIIVRQYVAELAQACPYIDEVIVNHTQPMVDDQNYAAEFINRIRAAKFDVAICPIYSRDKVSDIIMMNSGASERIVSTGNDSNMSLEQISNNNPHFTKLVPARAGTLSEVERNKEFLEGLGVIIDLPYKTTVWMEQEHKDFAEGLLKELNVERPIVAGPFAQFPQKNWSLQKWAKLISNHEDHPILICGADRDTREAENLISLTNHGNIHNLCGKTTLRQLAAVLASSELYLGVDSGSAHIAATVNCPQVVIMGGGHFGRFFPYSPLTSTVSLPLDCYGCNWRCRYQQNHCVKDIVPEVVEEALLHTLAKPSGKPKIFLQGDSLWEPRQGQPFWKPVDGFLDVSNVEIVTVERFESTKGQENKYLVTAIVSTYNSERFIRDCLEDLENQTIADRLEIIVVNSGSQQNEESIVKEFQRKYDNIKYIKTEKRETIYAAWNRAIKAASGKYITNANTDDRHTEDALEKMAKALEEHPDKALVYANYLEVKETNGQMIPVKNMIPGEFSRARLFKGECPPSLQPMWRKSVHEVFGYFDERFFISGDYEFWFRLTQKYDFLYLNEILGQGNIGSKAVSQNNDDILNWENMIINKCYQYALQEAITIGTTGISEHPVFSNGPEVNIWKQNIKAKLEDRGMSLVDNIKESWDFRTNPSPKLTIIIVAYNRHKELLENLYALNEQNEKDFEVIVIDNGSDLSWLKQHKDEFNFSLCGVELNLNFGPSPARNIGTEFAKAEYIAFLDDDAVADKHLVRNILEHFENYRICGLRGKVLPKSQTNSEDAPVNYDLGDRIITTACEVSCLSAFRKDVLIKMGGFDELLFGSEGMELSYRICKAQKEKVKSILYFPDVIVYHDHRPYGPAQTEKTLRQDRMELLAHQKDNEITGYKELVHSLYPGNKAIFENNSNDYTWVINVAIYLQKNFPKEAIEWAKKAVTLRPDGFKGCYILGSLYTWFGRHDEALALLERIYEPLRNSVISGGSEFISSEFEKQVDISECYVSVCTQLAQCYIETNQYDRVKQVYTDLLNNPNLTIPEEQKAVILNVLTKLDRTPPAPVAAEKKNNIVASVKPEQDYLVSAIVSTYNSEKFLRGCLDDLEQQTIADELEIVVVNSGSRQNEEAIVREYQQKYNNIVYIKTEQREGIYAAWNRAVKVAQGTFITNANTDDRHRKDALEIMAETLLANPDAALVYGDQICTDTPNGTFANHHAIEMAKRAEYSHERLLFGCCVGSQPMWRKSLHNELGYFDDTLTCAGDWDFWLRISISSRYKFKHIPEFLGIYYYNENGIEHGRKIHSLYERYIVGKRYGNPYISVIPLYTSKDNPLVSVIMPAYNAAKHIAETIESVLIQNYRNFELIIVDDGSTDNTKDIIASFKDDKIKYFYKDNGGPSGSRNLAIKKAEGQYIMPLDADDMMTPDFISKHLAEFEKHPNADLVYCDVLLIDDNSTPIRTMNKPEYQDRRHLIRDLLRAGHPIVPFRLGIRRSVFDRIGFYDENLLIAEDYDMMRRFVKAGLKAQHLSEPLHLRRMHADSLSGNQSAQKAKFHFGVIKRFIDTFTYDELFPDVAWDEISPQMRQLHAKCLAAETYLAIGQDYVKTNAIEYSRTAFDQACSELNDCVTMDPENQGLRQLLQKSKLIRARYTDAPQQVVSK